MIAADLKAVLWPLISGGIYPSVAPAGVVAPYGVYQMISGVPVNDLSGASNLTNARFQVDLFARDKAALDALAETVKTAMNGATQFKSLCEMQQDIYEDPAQYYRISMDFSIWY